MPQLEIIPVQSRRERKQFFDLPWELYRGDPYWIPPIRVVKKELLNFKHHPFYDDADIRHFLALRDGKPVKDQAELHSVVEGIVGEFRQRRLPFLRQTGVL